MPSRIHKTQSPGGQSWCPFCLTSVIMKVNLFNLMPLSLNLRNFRAEITMLNWFNVSSSGRNHANLQGCLSQRMLYSFRETACVFIRQGDPELLLQPWGCLLGKLLCMKDWHFYLAPFSLVTGRTEPHDTKDDFRRETWIIKAVPHQQ